MKYNVLCALPNASNEINGVAFENVEGGVQASGLTAEEAGMFRGIPGYSILDAQPESAAERKAREAAERAAAEAAEREAAEEAARRAEAEAAAAAAAEAEAEAAAAQAEKDAADAAKAEKKA